LIPIGAKVTRKDLSLARLHVPIIEPSKLNAILGFGFSKAPDKLHFRDLRFEGFSLGMLQEEE
jgi:hypothetical protein